MERDHDRIEFEVTRAHLAQWQVAVWVFAIPLGWCAFETIAHLPVLFAVAAVVLLVQRERVRVRVQPEWLLVWRSVPGFGRPVLERYAIAGIATARAQRRPGGWWVQVRMRPPFHTNVVDLPVAGGARAKALADTLASEAEAARSRADPAVARSRIVVPAELTDLVDRDRR